MGKDDATGLTLASSNGRLKSTLDGDVKQMLEQRVRACKDLLSEGTGKPAEEIVKASEQEGYDLIVMGSSRIVSPVRILGSTAGRVLDSTKKPVLLIHE